MTTSVTRRCTSTPTRLKAHQLVGKGAYQVTFPKGQFLPVKGFWSLMVYNTEHAFSPNAINRFSHMEP